MRRRHSLPTRVAHSGVLKTCAPVRGTLTHPIKNIKGGRPIGAVTFDVSETAAYLRMPSSFWAMRAR